MVSPGIAEERATSGPAREIVALAIAAALVPLNSTMIAVAIPAIGRDFHAEAGALTQWLVTSYLLVGIVCQSPAGKLGDLWGYRRALALGQLVFAAGTLTGFAARNVPALTFARVLMAGGGAIMAPSAMALLRTRLPPDRRARAFGLFGAVMGLAAAIGPVLGGELTARFGWSSLFLANAPLLALSATLAFAGTPPADAATSPAAVRPKFDIAGSLLLGVALATLVLGAKAPGGYGVALAGGGLLGLAGFFAWERKAADPVVDVALFRSRPFAAGSLVVALQNLAMYALLFELPFYFTQMFGAGSGRSGRALVAMMASMVVASPLGGRLAERAGARVTVVLGSLSALVGVASLGLRTLTSPGDAVPSLVLLGVGLGLSTAPSQAAAMNAVAGRQSGMAAGVMSTMRYLGGVAGVAVLGPLLVPGTPDVVTYHHKIGVAVFAVSLALAMVVALALPSRAPARPT